MARLRALTHPMRKARTSALQQRYIGQLMRNTGTLFANDLRRDRCKELLVIFLIWSNASGFSSGLHNLHPIHSIGDATLPQALVANVHRLGLTNVVVSAPQELKPENSKRQNMSKSVPTLYTSRRFETPLSGPGRTWMARSSRRCCRAWIGPDAKT